MGQNDDNHHKIVVVATDGSERDVICHTLIGQGVSVVAFSSVPELISGGVVANMEVIILAPDDHGADAQAMFGDLSQKCGFENVPVLILCSQDENVDWSSGKSELIDFIRRPFSRELFLHRLRILRRLGESCAQVTAMHEQLVEAQKMECVGALAAGVAHEFNNLMCSVMGFAEMARQDGGSDIEALRESAEISYQVAKRATATAGSLLAFSRQTKSPKTLADINEAILHAVRLLRRDMDKASIAIKLDLSDVPQTCFSFGPMQQVLINLIINAWHAMIEKEGARIVTIKSLCADGSRIKITVEDTGKGIDPAVVGRIFEPFFTTKKGKDGQSGIVGSGLGLSIVKEVIRDHDGLISVESQLGQGTVFTITLPVTEVVAELEDDAETLLGGTATVNPAARKYTILVVDDEEPNRRILARLLQKNGHEVITAANMAEAVTLIWSRSIDLIVLDMIMPGSDGVTSIGQLREEGITAPILICTGQMDKKEINRGLEAGANDVVMKPFSSSEFLGAMYACMSKFEAARS